jgi:outer membrane protein assembly factor BamB
MTRRLLTLLTLLLLPGAAPAENWPGWRGPARDGVSPEKGLPTRWSATENVRWKAELPGAGVSAPVVWGERVFVTASDGRLGDRLHLLCFHRDSGKELWHARFFGSAASEGQFAPGGMAVPTPATDGRRVFALFGTGDLVCVDADGRPVWVRSLAQEYGPFRNRWGMAASPALAGDLLAVQVDHPGASYLLGVEAATGANRWRTKRDASVNWSSPLPVKVGKALQIVAAGTYALRGYAADTGEELWSVRGLQMQCIPTPVASGDRLFAAGGRDSSVLSLRLDDARGDLTKTHVAWAARSATNIPSPLVLDGLCYCAEDGGFANCFKADGGERVWRDRLGGGKYSASPVAGDGKVFFASESGRVTVVRAGPKFEVLARNDVGESVVASPALSQGCLFLRGDRHLYCIGQPAPADEGRGEKLPDYRPVPGWPKLPDGVTLGPVSAVATDSSDRVYVFHRGKRPVLVFDRDGKFLRSWGDDHLKTPHGLRIDKDGNVWVTDIGTHQVLKFDADGKLLLALGKKGQPGAGPDQFDRPTDVAVAPTGEFYVSDGYGNSRVLKFSKDGKLVKQWGRKGKGEGEFDLPHAICLDARGRVYVGDRENDRVLVFDADGKFLAVWKESGAPYGLFLAGDRLFVADGRAGWVKVLDGDGKPLGRFGEKGSGPGQFKMPHMLCVDSRGAVYVAEVDGKRVQKFEAGAAPVRGAVDRPPAHPVPGQGP